MFNYRHKFINPASFERQIAFFAKQYTILPLDEAIEKLRAGTLPARALCITFDDGYRNNFEFAFPVLKKYDAPATVLLATDFVFEGKPLWVDRLEYAMEHANGSIDERRRRDDALRNELKHVPEAEKIARLEALERECDAELARANRPKRARLRLREDGAKDD